MELTREETHYDIGSLKANIGKIKKNIMIFEEAIEKERGEMERLQRIVKALEASK